MSKRPILLWLAVIVAIPQIVRADAPANTDPPAHPMHGVTFRHEIRPDVPLHLFIVTVDLSDPAVHIKVSRGGEDPNLQKPWETTLMPVSQMAQRDGLSLAVNGNFFQPKDYQMILGRRVYYFDGNWARACGWAMSDGMLFSQTPVAPDWPSLIFPGNGRAAIGEFSKLSSNAGGAGQVVSGHFQIVTEGRNTSPTNSTEDRPAPRTAAGLDRDGKTLFLLVADGRRSDYSIGLSMHGLGDEMIRLGSFDAITLDGGGSSTMVMRDAENKIQLINYPSDGHDLAVPLSVERAVADALGVIVDDSNHPATRTQPK